MMARKPKNEARRQEAARRTWARKDAADITVKNDPSTLVANSGADTSGYTALQKKAAELVGSATEIAQFLDRDTRPDFASTVMIPALQQFIKNPKDIDGLARPASRTRRSRSSPADGGRGRTSCPTCP